MSQDQFAERMREHGVNWSRSAVVNFEVRASGSRGRSVGRDAVTIGEWFAMAEVLGVPPAWLLVDVEGGTPTPVAKGREADPWSALLWLAGRWPLDDEPGTWWARVAPAIGTAFAYSSAVDQIRQNQAEQSARALLPDAAAHMDSVEQIDERDRRVLRLLAANLAYLARAGLVLPPVPKDIADRAAELDIDLPTAEDA